MRLAYCVTSMKLAIAERTLAFVSDSSHSRCRFEVHDLQGYYTDTTQKKKRANAFRVRFGILRDEPQQYTIFTCNFTQIRDGKNEFGWCLISVRAPDVQQASELSTSTCSQTSFRAASGAVTPLLETNNHKIGHLHPADAAPSDSARGEEQTTALSERIPY